MDVFFVGVRRSRYIDDMGFFLLLFLLFLHFLLTILTIPFLLFLLTVLFFFFSSWFG